MLSVQPGALFWNSVVNQQGTIESSGNLLVGKNLSLNGTNLDLMGQVQAQGDMTLRATDTLKIRDSASNPFVAAAGGKLLVQGDKAVDIFALNHPNSGLFSGGDMVLRSASQVGGDAHYWSGGNFQIKNSEGNSGGLFSPNDPVIIARGDVIFQTYTGASLHIYAGGSVNIPGGIQITSSDLFFGVTEDVRLSDGTIVAIRGASEPTIDIRSGINQSLIPGDGINTVGNGLFSVLPGQGVFSIPTGSDINIGAMLFSDGVVFPTGKILLTNQYQPNPSLVNGNIQVSALPSLLPGSGTAIQTFSSVGDGGSVFIDSRGDIRMALVPLGGRMISSLA